MSDLECLVCEGKFKVQSINAFGAKDWDDERKKMLEHFIEKHPGIIINLLKEKEMVL
ncbi:MAG: hypothetical protein QQN41_10440 [Nitrosopumilus sp.]